MDPIRNLCLVKDSWVTDEKINKNIEKFSEEIIGSPRAIRSKIFSEKGNKEKEEKKIEKGKILSLDIADPFLKIDSYFKKRSSLVLANLDIIYNFTGQYEGYLLPQVYKDFDYLCLDSNSGFLEYLKYRLPKARDFIGYTTYIPLDLVLSNSLNYRENLIQALKLCKEGGTFISRINTDTSKDLLYITSLCFRTISIFKPFLENLNDDYSYIVAESYKGNSLDILTLLEKGNMNVKISESFNSYFSKYYKSLSDLRNSLRDEKYNMYRCKAILNIF